MAGTHPRLVGDGPGGSGRGEQAPAVAAGELGGTIGTKRGANRVTVLVVVVHTSEERQELVVGIVVVVGRGRLAGREEVPGHGSIVGCIEAVHHEREEVALGDGEFLTRKDAEVMVLAKDVGKVIAQRIGIAVLGTESFLVLVGNARLVGGVVGHIVSGHTVEAVVGLGVFLQAALDLEAKVVNDFPVEGCVGVEGNADAAGIVVGYRQERRSVVAIVLLLVHTLDGGGDGNGSIGNGVLETAVTGGGAGILDAVGAATAHVGAGIADVGVDGSMGRCLEVALEGEVVTAVSGAGHDGLVAHVGIADGPVHALAASAHGEVGGEGGTGLSEDGLDPVVGGHALVQVDILEVAEVRVVVGGEVVTDDAQLILELHVVVGVHSLDGALVGHGLETPVSIELDRNLLAFLGALGGDNHNAVGTTGTVDGGGESILEDVNGLDLGGRNVVDGFHREAVHDVEGAAVLGDGTAAADADLDIGVRVTFRGHDGHTGHLTGERLRHGGHGLLGQFVRADGGDGSQEVAALDGGITHHNHLVQEGLVGLQDHVDFALAVNGHGLVCQSDKGEDQVHSICRDGKDVVAVDTRDGADGGSFHHDAGPNQGFSVFVGHNTLDGILGRCDEARSDAKC